MSFSSNSTRGNLLTRLCLQGRHILFQNVNPKIGLSIYQCRSHAARILIVDLIGQEY